ncbi:S9 family peptidase [Urechidicola vernalis]|uniref:DPP IV N-terminal domain-containing protein n=1 Tax=Urechidicola vernalis TaxID=3075600 RepID=A0ABU2Y182_9FLAO|nr:DPP IV N-terminal domain-containing protein [Urechidicola sp. P050]MDT0551958.1 DPP IV N-terminal domain-containing protein [Urechidicola sp. P050]
MKLKKLITSRKLLALILTGGVFSLNAQDKLKSMPGYENYTIVSPKINDAIVSGAVPSKWSEDSKSFTYIFDGDQYEFDVKSKKSELIGEAPKTEFRRRRGPARGRQHASVDSPNNKLKAFTKDRDMHISNIDGSNKITITNANDDVEKVKYGIATWVYGEELRQTSAIWWSPDNKKVAFYRFKEKDIQQYYVLLNQTKIQDSLEIMSYPKVGAKNLPVDLMIYDLESKKTTLVNARDGQAFNDGAIGTYLYGINWSTDSNELLYHSTNRKQDIMEYKAANATTGESRIVIREKWLASFTKNSPEIKVLEDGKRFIWASERSGFNNYYLYNFDGTLIKPLTQHNFEVSRIVKIDENKGVVYYLARSGDNHMKMQLHSVKFDGSKDKRLTDPALNNTVSIAPNNKYFTVVSQAHNKAPFTNLMSMNGKKVSEIAKSDLTVYKKLGFKKAERFNFTSADGETTLDGLIHFPSNFDETKKYPVLLSIYGGPATNGFRENFAKPNSLTEYGFIVVNLDGRNVGGRGKHLLDKLYGNLGIVEMDDFAEGIKALHDRPYINKDKVGVYGTSYGGTTAAMSLLRFPDVYHAAVANSAVTHWKNYDNIYTERFMNLLENNEEGYDNSSIMKYAPNLKGDLMIFFGTSDNNVHPSNSLQLIEALQKAEKSFEVQVGPDKGHTRVNTDRMMEFFIESLVID